MSEYFQSKAAGYFQERASTGGERRVRYRAARLGLAVVKTRGAEHERRKRAGAGAYLLIDQATHTVALSAATLDDVAAYLRGRGPAQPRYRQ